MQEDIKKINLADPFYPKLLKKIADPPQKLFWQGQLLPAEKYFAIVGTRRCSDYGREAALVLAADLARAGLTIVSGFAPGIDTICHKAALEAGGRTVAVLGTGLDESSIYPQENITLARKILAADGALISEYPPGTHGSKLTFPQRNRIIAGMSLGVLVVEAKLKSGSLITANFARKFGRKLFAVPGSITATNSKGTNLLLKQGAILVENANDILKTLGLEKLRKQNRVPTASPEEALALKALAQGSLHIDEIIAKSGLMPGQAAATLNLLEINGMVKNLGGNVYAKVR